MHHKFGLTPFPLTSMRTKRRSTRVAPQASDLPEVQTEPAETIGAESPVTGSPATAAERTTEDPAE